MDKFSLTRELKSEMASTILENTQQARRRDVDLELPAYKGAQKPINHHSQRAQQQTRYT